MQLGIDEHHGLFRRLEFVFRDYLAVLGDCVEENSLGSRLWFLVLRDNVVITQVLKRAFAGNRGTDGFRFAVNNNLFFNRGSLPARADIGEIPSWL